MRKTVLSLLLSVAFLTGCAQEVVRVETVRPEIPETLRTCPPLPEPPETESQARVGLWILDLVEAFDDCRERHRAVIDLIDRFQQP